MKNSLRLFLSTTWSVLTLIGLIACVNAGDKASETTDSIDPAEAALRSLEKEIIDVHDEVMPKMAALNNTRVKLLKQYGDENLNPEKRKALAGAIMQLEEADSLMWDWMHNFTRPDYNGNLDSVKIYLDNEKITVLYMKEKFLASMEQGETLLLKLDQDDN